MSAALSVVPRPASEVTKPSLITIATLAKRWQVSPSLVRKWLRGGQLPHFRLGTRVLIAESDAGVFLASRRHEGTR